MSADSRPARRTRRSGFVERTLVDINHTLEQSVFAERTARQPGLLQKLDARLKILSTLLLLLAVGLSHSLLVILSLYFLALALAFFSKIPLAFFVKRVWLLIPFFTGVIALPALFITPGTVLGFSIGHGSPGGVAVQAAPVVWAGHHPNRPCHRRVPAAAGGNIGLTGGPAGADHTLEQRA